MSTEPDVPVAYDGHGAPVYEHQLDPPEDCTAGDVEALAKVLDEHAGCQPNAGQDNTGSGTSGFDVWSCGIRVPFVEDLETMERLHLATALAAHVTQIRERASA